MNSPVAARAVSADLLEISDKHHRALHDQILECLTTIRSSAMQPSNHPLELLRLGSGGQFRAALGWHAGELALLAVGRWHEDALLIGGQNVTRFKLRGAHGIARKRIRPTLLTHNDRIIGVILPAPEDAVDLEALMLEHSPKLWKLLRKRGAALERDDELTVGHAFGLR